MFINPEWLFLMQGNTVASTKAKKDLENTKHEWLWGGFSVNVSSMFCKCCLFIYLFIYLFILFSIYSPLTNLFQLTIRLNFHKQ